MGDILPQSGLEPRVEDRHWHRLASMWLSGSGGPRNSAAHKPDKRIFDRNIIPEDEGPRWPDAEIQWPSDLLEG